MKILVVGGTGTIGRAVVNELAPYHTLIVAGHTQGDLQVDITKSESIVRMYQSIGMIDAVISTTGKVYFDSIAKMTDETYQVGIKSKLMGQVNLVLIGLKYINNSGSFTLTSGILNHYPITKGSSASMVNGALDGFVKAAAIELPNNIRINIVSPTVLTESLDKFGEYFKGYQPVSANEVALAYRESVEGSQTGQVYRVGYDL